MLTPDFIRRRPFPKYGAVSDKWRDGWTRTLESVAAAATIDLIVEVQNFLNDFAMRKEPFFIQSLLHRIGDDRVLRSMGLANCAAVMQNVNDCFAFLLKSDQVRGTRTFLDSAQRFLETAVIHTGFLNLFEYKRLFASFLKGARTHHAEDSIKVIWQSLAASPSRIAVYNEANIYSYVKTNDETGWSVIGGFKLQVPITTGLIYDWAATNLGENYLASFSKTQCLQIAKAYVLQRADEKFLEQSLRYFIGSDFEFFVEHIVELKNTAAKPPPSRSCDD